MTQVETKKVDNKLNLNDIDLNAIVAKARGSFGKAEKSMAAQISTGANISRPTDPEDFIVFTGGEHWKKATGIIGLPFGRIVQIAGRPDSGKSTHALAFMKAAQDQGVVVIFWDTEGKYSPSRFDNFFKGDSSKLLIVSSRVILEGADMVNALTESVMENYPNKKVLIVWDSVGGTLDSSSETKDLRDTRQMAIAAKEVGSVMRSWVGMMERYKDKKLNKEKIAVLLINQTYANIGSPGDTAAGGTKVAFHSSLIAQMTRRADLHKVKNGIKYKTGILSRFRISKNHLSDMELSIAELNLSISAGSICEQGKKEDSDEEEWGGDEEEDS